MRYDWNPDRLAMLPEHLREGMRRYVEQGIRPGHGLWTILTNQRLSDVLGHLDKDTSAALQDIWRFIYNYVPGPAWGDAKVVEQWIMQGGMRGHDAS